MKISFIFFHLYLNGAQWYKEITSFLQICEIFQKYINMVSILFFDSGFTNLPILAELLLEKP